MSPGSSPIRILKIATRYFFLLLFVLLCCYASMNTLTLILWGDPSLHGEPRLFLPPEIMILRYVGWISPELARFLVTLLFCSCGLFLWLGFRQITRKTSLDHPLRDQIVCFIRSHPGCHFRLIARETGINRGTLAYHLGQLTSFGLVHEAGDGGLTRYFVCRNDLPALEQKILNHRENAVRNRILGMLDMDTNALGTDLKKNLNLSGPALWYHMHILKEDGIILTEQEPGKTGRPVKYSLTDNAAAILRKMNQELQDRTELTGHAPGIPGREPEP